MRYMFSLIFVLLSLAYAQTPFPCAFQTATNAAEISAISSLETSYVESLVKQPAYTSFSEYMATATSLSEDELNAYGRALNNPILLGIEFFTATATPAWYTEIPSDLQSYVSSVANAEASICTKVVSGAERLGARVTIMGTLLAAAFVGILML